MDGHALLLVRSRDNEHPAPRERRGGRPGNTAKRRAQRRRGGTRPHIGQLSVPSQPGSHLLIQDAQLTIVRIEEDRNDVKNGLARGTKERHWRNGRQGSILRGTRLGTSRKPRNLPAREGGAILVAPRHDATRRHLPTCQRGGLQPACGVVRMASRSDSDGRCSCHARRRHI